MLAGRVVLVTGATSGFGTELALGLGDAGATVAVAHAPIADRDDAARAFADTAEGSGPIDAVVHALADPDSLRPEPLAQTDAAGWDARGEGVVRSALWCFQAACDAFGERGGHIVVITPTVGLTGGAGLVPYATAVEGVRALVKSAARQWGERDIALNCVAPAVELLGSGQGPEGAAPALGRAADVRADVAPVVAMLLAGPFVTGATVVVDGGVVMAP